MRPSRSIIAQLDIFVILLSCVGPIVQGACIRRPRNPRGSQVVGIETIRLVLSLASTNNLKICAADVGNAFLYADNPEKTKILAGPEFGDLEGQYLIVQGAWYGQRTAAAAFHGHLADTLKSMGFKPSRADADLWYRERGANMNIWPVMWTMLL